MTGSFWDLIILNPMVNFLIWLYSLLGNNYVLAILVFTLITRVILFPLTWQQQKSSLKMQEFAPELKKLQEKYKNDPETLGRKQMEFYREAGMGPLGPLGGCLPLLLQFPIIIGLYSALRLSLAASPLELMNLSQHIYLSLPAWLAWLPDAPSLIPLNNHFLWLNLAAPDPTLALPALVFVSTWLQNKLITPASTDPQQAQMSRTMQFMTPVMLVFFSFSVPSGLSIYWVVSNIIGFGQYMAMGRASLKNLFGTPDGSFSLRGLIGLPLPETTGKGRTKRNR